jgi:hypothetical protein
VLRSLLYYEPERAALWPAGVLGVMHVLLKALGGHNEFTSLFPEILLIGIVGFIQGVCFLYLVAFGMSLVANWFKGYGLFEQIKLIVSWSCFPFLFGLPVLLVLAVSLAAFGSDQPSGVGDGIGVAYLAIAGFWGIYIQWSGIRILFKGDKILPAGIIILPYILIASFVFLAQQLYNLFH